MEKLDYERICACALGRVFGYEPLYVSGLIGKLGSASAVFGMRTEEIDRILGPHSKYRGKVGPWLTEGAEAELDMLKDHGCYYIACTEEAFPKLLKECQDCPAGLYVRSSSPPEDIFTSAPSVAVVGTRDISPYGREWTRKIVEACSQAPAKPVIVSGLAFGVDITAHGSALDFGLPTIAVLPCGIDEIYPSSHRKAAERIADAPGSALVTDYPPLTRPVAFTFIRRNRIIAGLSSCTVLIESKANGGGLITCRLADGYSRDVFALPGRVDDPRSAGCNALIRNHTAEAITGLAGLGEQLGLGRYDLRKKASLSEMISSWYAGQEELEALLEVAGTIRSHRSIDMEDLAAETGRSYSETVRLATTLESDGFICIDLTQRCSINPKKL
jgi:DNA processing protein